MKHFSTFLSMLLLLLVGGVQTTTAQQDNIDWSKYASTVEEVMNNKNQYVYLYNLTKKGFLNTGGDYGMKAVLNTRGIRLELEKHETNSSTNYAFKSPVVNSAQGSYLAVKNGKDCIYIDRSLDDNIQRDCGYMDLDKGTNNTYKIKITNGLREGYYLCSRENRATFSYEENEQTVTYFDVQAYTNDDKQADEWCLVTLDDYRRVTTKTSTLGEYNVSGLLYNTRFIRNVSDVNNLFWQTSDEIVYESSDYCTSIAPEMGTNDDTDGYAGEYGAFGCLEMGHVTGEFYQVVNGLQPGLYEVSAQAFFHRNDGWPYTNGSYGTDNTATASNAVIFANDATATIPMISGDDENEFEDLIKSHLKKLSSTARQYFRRNVPAAYFLAYGNQYAPDESRCKVTVPVIVGKDGVLTLGIRKTGMEGRVYMDNMTLTYLGNTIDDQFGFGVDAYGAKEEVDAKKYTKPGYMFYLSRMFADGVWNALTLPVNLTSVQLTNTFGNDMELVKLTGLNPQNPNQIFFKPVNLNGGEGLEAGQCYLVKVTKAPEHPANENFTFKTIDETLEEHAYLEKNVKEVSYQCGNVYQFLDVKCPDGISSEPVSYTTKDEKLKWTACYYASDYAPKGSYIMSGGDMYHLSTDWNNLIGTTWYIEKVNASQGSLTFVIDNGNGTTDINGIVTETPAGKAAEGVYTINGQKVASDKSLNDLPKGIYIVNGKKYIVR